MKAVWDFPRRLWNAVCPRRRRRLLLAAVCVLLVLPWLISPWDFTRDQGAAQASLVPFLSDARERKPPAPTPYEPYRQEAEAVARVLYGVRDNKERDQRTYVWCILNRVDNPSPEFADTLEAVIGKPEQWMFYDPENPVLEPLYRIALQELTAWHEGRRPVSWAFVYAEWSPDDIVLRDTWDYSGKTKTWRYPAD